MEGDEEFDLEKKFEELSLDSSSSGGGTDLADRDLQLAQLIARVTADLPSTVCNENSKANHDSAEKNSGQPKSVMVANCHRNSAVICGSPSYSETIPLQNRLRICAFPTCVSAPAHR